MKEPDESVGQEYLRDTDEPYFTSSERRGRQVVIFFSSLLVIGMIAAGYTLAAIAFSLLAIFILLVLR